jgi:hypothetical protein
VEPNKRIWLNVDLLARLMWQIEREAGHTLRKGGKKLVISLGDRQRKEPRLELRRTSWPPSNNALLIYHQGAWQITAEDVFQNFKKVKRRIRRTSWEGLRGLLQVRGYKLCFDSRLRPITTVEAMLKDCFQVEEIQPSLALEVAC